MKRCSLPFMLIFLATSFINLLLSMEIRKDNQLRISKNIQWDNKNIVLEEKLRIGSDDFDKENYVFGAITDIAIDTKGFIFILDSKNSRIQKYSPQGLFIQSIGKGRGAGPGELSRPRNISVNDEGDIFVADMDLLRITIFNSKGELLKTIKTIIQPIDMVTGKNNDVYVTGSFDMGRYKIYRYNIIDGKLNKVFCKEVNNKNDSILISNIGGTGRLAITKEGNVYFSFFYPYLIRKYSPEGNLINQFARKASFYKLPIVDNIGKIKDVLVGSHELAVLPGEKVIHVIKHIDMINSKANLYFDFFDKTGNWLISFPSTIFEPDWSGKVLSVDWEGYLYMDFWEPFPHVRKFSLAFSDN